MLHARCLFANHWTASISFVFLTFFLSACQFVGIPTDNEVLSYPFNTETVWEVADSTMTIAKKQGWMYADTYTRPFYQQSTPDLLWATEDGIDERADTLLHYLNEVERYGLKRSSFHIEEIEQNLKELRALAPDSCEESQVCTLQGRLEYLLSEAYMRYSYGQRYGYVRPHKLFNNLLPDTPETSEPRYRQIFDIHCDIPTDSLFGVALKSLEDAKSLSKFLQSIQPQGKLYHKFAKELQEAKDAKDEELQRLCTINMERSRWRYPHPTEEKFVWVNLSDFTMIAVDTPNDTTLSMKICGGDQKHKTPLLQSRISRLELNPYWVIPTSIIRNELIPHHLHDSSYYARNKIVAINNQNGTETHPWLLSADQLRSGIYTLRQEKGEGNSLGRMIFRFPNDFAVYLHDTNNPGAFNRSVRAVSHGCVRVERPLDLALFLMDFPDEYTTDLLRIAIGKKPLSEKGKALIEEKPDAEGLKNHYFKPSIPVYIDYYSLYPSFISGKMEKHADHYGYDKEIEKILNQF